MLGSKKIRKNTNFNKHQKIFRRLDNVRSLLDCRLLKHHIFSENNDGKNLALKLHIIKNRFIKKLSRKFRKKMAFTGICHFLYLFK